MLSRRWHRRPMIGQHEGGGRAHRTDQNFFNKHSGPFNATDVLVCNDRMVNEAIRFNRDHARQYPQVEDVAQHLNTSRSTLIRRFYQAMGRSVSSEIKRQQVNEVKLLLLQTNRAISSISSECRFSSPGQLSRFFKRETGVSPSEYRRGRLVPETAIVYQSKAEDDNRGKG